MIQERKEAKGIIFEKPQEQSFILLDFLNAFFKFKDTHFKWADEDKMSSRYSITGISTEEKDIYTDALKSIGIDPEWKNDVNWSGCFSLELTENEKNNVVDVFSNLNVQRRVINGWKHCEAISCEVNASEKKEFESLLQELNLSLDNPFIKIKGNKYIVNARFSDLAMNNIGKISTHLLFLLAITVLLKDSSKIDSTQINIESHAFTEEPIKLPGSGKTFEPFGSTSDEDALPGIRYRGDIIEFKNEINKLFSDPRLPKPELKLLGLIEQPQWSYSTYMFPSVEHFAFLIAKPPFHYSLKEHGNPSDRIKELKMGFNLFDQSKGYLTAPIEKLVMSYEEYFSPTLKEFIDSKMKGSSLTLNKDDLKKVIEIIAEYKNSGPKP